MLGPVPLGDRFNISLNDAMITPHDRNFEIIHFSVFFRDNLKFWHLIDIDSLKKRKKTIRGHCSKSTKTGF